MKFCTPFDDALGAMKKGNWRPTPAQLETHPSPPCLGREPCEWDIRKCAT